MDANTPTGEQFNGWWKQNADQLSVANSEEVARSAWDAAVLTAAQIIRSEKRALLESKTPEYEVAAHLRDCCSAVVATFTKNNLLEELDDAQARSRQVDWHREKYRGLPTEQFLQLSAPQPGCEAAIAFEQVKRERLGR